jgi:ERCC4-type nuclease
VSGSSEVLVTADVFEDGSGVPSRLQQLGAQVVVEALPAGDYRIDGGVLVERKTVADLHGSLARGRLWSQVGRVRDIGVLPFLFVEGDVESRRKTDRVVRLVPAAETGDTPDARRKTGSDSRGAA